jgi:hypothetical protein
MRIPGSPALPRLWKARFSGALLVAANTLPLLGVLFWGWSAFALLILFWFENVLIGACNILKMAANRPTEVASNLGKLFLIPFFTLHYGMFTLAHGAFLCLLLGKKELELPPDADFFDYVYRLAPYFLKTGLIWGALCLSASHLGSFFLNYLGRGEYRRTTLSALMHAPYARVVVLHITIIFGGFLVMALGSPSWALALLVVLKTGFDLFCHERSHRGTGAGLPRGTALSPG